MCVCACVVNGNGNMMYLACLTGFYMYIETSFPRTAGDVANLISPLYPVPPTQNCRVSFWYHMFGSTIASLTVYAVQPLQPDILLFNQTGAVGNFWQQGFLNVSQVVTGNYQVCSYIVVGYKTVSLVFNLQYCTSFGPINFVTRAWRTFFIL